MILVQLLLILPSAALASTHHHPGEECWTSQGCTDEGSAPCIWCGGDNWYCCSATAKYSASDKCSKVRYYSQDSDYRCAMQEIFTYDNRQRNYDDSVEYCQSEGLFIASIRNQAEHEEVRDLLTGPAYLGATSVGGNWSWADGQPWDFMNQFGDLAGASDSWLIMMPSGNLQTREDSATKRGVVCRRSSTIVVITGVQDGEYFYFDEENWFTVFRGRTSSTPSTHQVEQWRQNKKVWEGTVSVLTNYGRRYNGAGKGQWQVGDLIREVVLTNGPECVSQQCLLEDYSTRAVCSSYNRDYHRNRSKLKPEPKCRTDAQTGEIVCEDEATCKGVEDDVRTREALAVIYDCSVCPGVQLQGCCEECETNMNRSAAGTFDIAEVPVISVTCEGCSVDKIQEMLAQNEDKCSRDPETGRFFCSTSERCKVGQRNIQTERTECRITPCDICEEDYLKSECCSKCLDHVCQTSVSPVQICAGCHDTCDRIDFGGSETLPPVAQATPAPLANTTTVQPSRRPVTNSCYLCSASALALLLPLLLASMNSNYLSY